ncbi:MAG: Hpt domain-containing protein [Burkholderiales bacterium]|nr:Hpt domain-containing protein [Burkholderiales bacterium]
MNESGLTSLYGIEGLDPQDGLSHFGDEEIYLRMLAKFTMLHQGIRQDVLKAFENRDAEAAMAMLHKVRGAAGYVGATAVAETALRIERDLRENGQFGEILGMVDLLEDTLVRMNQAIRLALGLS